MVYVYDNIDFDLEVLIFGEFLSISEKKIFTVLIKPLIFHRPAQQMKWATLFNKLINYLGHLHRNTPPEIAPLCMTEM